MPALVAPAAAALLLLAANVPSTASSAAPSTAARAASARDPYLDSRGTWGQDDGDQWGLAAIGLPDGGPPPAPGAADVVVAVIDTGLDYLHPDLDSRTVWVNPDELDNGLDDDGNGYVDDLIGWNWVEDDNNPWDYAGHGTHVAGIVAAATGNGEGIAAVAPGVRILPLRVLSQIGQGRSSQIAAAIDYAVDEGARVINLSLGGEKPSETERRAVAYAVAHGVLVVVAAGNDSADVAGAGPAALDDVLTVGALGPDGRVAGFSNWGDAVDVVAPGVEILSLRARRTDFIRFTEASGYRPGSAFVGPGNRYYRASGTSFAAPFVSATAALLWSRDPSLTAEQVRRMIVQSARDVEVPGVDRFSGYGALDAGAALDADPRFHVDAAVAGVGVVRQGGATLVRVRGTADADRFAEAWLELGRGEAPERFERVADRLRASVVDGPLGDIDASALAGSKVWTLRLIVRHADGRRREARFKLSLD